MTGRPKQPPIYVLPHGIEVIGEYAPSKANRYWRVRIRPHRFFPNVVVRFGGAYVRRSRVILASKLGRALTAEEYAHHVDEDRSRDDTGNIELLSAGDHNRLHKTNSLHTDDTKNRICLSLKKAYADGRRKRTSIRTRDIKGRITT